MTKQEYLDLLKLLSAVESWSFASRTLMPDYLYEKIADGVAMLEREILK